MDYWHGQDFLLNYMILVLQQSQFETEPRMPGCSPERAKNPYTFYSTMMGEKKNEKLCLYL